LSTEEQRLVRALGLRDLTFLLIAAILNLNSVPVAASAGPSAIGLWILGFLFFFIPQGIAVLELSHRYPQEGGIYNWTKTAFGNMHAFVSGWCYWTNNIFYVPTLLFYLVGFAAFIGGDATAGIGNNTYWMAGISLFLLWSLTGLNILGLGVGKWVQSFGSMGAFLTTTIILGVGILSIGLHGMANAMPLQSLVPNLGQWTTWTIFGVVCLNYVGLELGAIMGDEIHEPRRNIPRAALLAGIFSVTMYVLATFALQTTVPVEEIGLIDGILQGVKHALSDLNMLWLLAPIALLMSLNAAGNASAWLAGAARIPFVIGIDRYLPQALGRIHRRYHTPHIALTVQSAASSLFIIINSIGSSVSEMYLILLQITIILQLIPYLYMFVALIRIRSGTSANGTTDGFFRSTWLCYGAGAVGFAVTAAGVFFAFLPASAVSDVWGFVLKIVLGVFSFLIPAFVIFRHNARKIGAAPAITPQQAEATVE